MPISTSARSRRAAQAGNHQFHRPSSGDVDLAAALWLFAGPLLLCAVTGMLAGAAGPRRPDDAEIAAMIRLFLDGTAA